MKSKTVRMVLAVVALTVICGAYAGVKTGVALQEKREEKSAEDAVNTIFSADKKKITSVGFMIDKNEVTFEKEQDTWVKQDEKMFPVNQNTLESAVSAVSSVDAERTLEKVENIEQYGLSEPSNTIKITTADGETTLRIGDKNNSSNQYYVSKDEDRNTVYLVKADVVEPFMKGLYDYAKKEEFPAVKATDTVNRITVTNEKTESYELQKEADTGFWDITSGKKGDEIEKADTAKASALTSSLGKLAYDAMADYNCTDKSKYGLDKPYAVIKANYQEEVPKADEKDSTEAGTEKTTAEAPKETDTGSEAKPEMIDKQLVVTVGAQAASGGRYVMVNDSSQVYTMTEESLMEFIGKSESDFWDLTINYLSVNRLDKLKITYEKKIHEVNVSRETSKDKDGKETEKNTYLLDGTEVDSTKFTAFYNKLINMAGQSRLTEKFSPATEPEMTVQFTSDDGKNTEVTFYAHDENYYTAVVEGKVYLVNKMTVKDLFTAYEKMVGENTKDMGDKE